MGCRYDDLVNGCANCPLADAVTLECKHPVTLGRALPVPLPEKSAPQWCHLREEDYRLIYAGEAK